jgi:receptor protein-tyrosine kinase
LSTGCRLINGERNALSLRDFLKLLRGRWYVIALATLACAIAAIAITLATTPLYQASTTLFVSTTTSKSVSEQYQGNRLSQDRVLSYVELIKGETLAQRTIDKLNLDMSAKELRSRVRATAKADTVLINVSVTDPSPVRARDIANAISDEFADMVKELETPGPGEKPDARVVVQQRASIPMSPIVPQKAQNLAVGVFLGLALGIGIAVLRDLLDNTVKDRETVEAITGVGLAGAIPIDKDRRVRPAIVFEQENSAIAEAFRKLRTNLQFLAVDNPPRVMVILSSAPSEGKSTTAINIALALAEAGNNVVLVDGDMRRPSMDKYLGVIGSIGFSTVLGGGASLAEVLQATKFPNLTVLAAGPTPPTPSELLGSQAA